MFLKFKNTTFQSITGKIYDFVTPLILHIIHIYIEEEKHFYKQYIYSTVQQLLS